MKGRELKIPIPPPIDISYPLVMFSNNIIYTIQHIFFLCHSIFSFLILEVSPQEKTTIKLGIVFILISILFYIGNICKL